MAGKRIKVKPDSEACHFHLKGAGFVPNQKFQIHWFDNTQKALQASDALTHLDRDYTHPLVTISQYNDDYGKIMFTRTAESTSNVVNVSEIDSTHALVQSYTFYFIHKLPPKIGGGPPWVRIQIEKQLPRFKKVREKSLSIRGPASTAPGACISPEAQAKLIDHGSSLKEIAQTSLLEGQCKTYDTYLDPGTGELFPEFEHLPAALESKVLCGKSLFLNISSYSKLGIPNTLFRGLEKLNQVGPRFSKLGFLEDESYKNEPFPFGLIPLSKQRPKTIGRLFSGASVQMSCVACHAAQLPDGRYSIGGLQRESRVS